MMLSNTQKRHLCQLARDAWQHTPDRAEWLEANPELTDAKVQAAWRHYHQSQAVGRQSLRLCTQDDYLRLVAHFQRLAGREVTAQRAERRAATDPKRRVWHLLMKALQERNLPLAYAGAICRRQFRCGLEGASEKQLWALLFTVRNRRKAA